MHATSSNLSQRSPNGSRPWGSRENVVAVIGGSLLLPLGATPDVIHADAVLLADVSAELARILPTGPAVTVPLASQQTTTTLMDRAAELAPAQFGPLREVTRRMPGGDLDAGLAAYYGLGAAAWSVAALSDGLAGRVEHDLIVPLWRKRNAALRHLHLRYFGSAAGGTGGPTAGRAAAFVADLLHRQLDCVVNVAGLHVGALTFLGLGDRIFLNAATTIAEQVAYTLDPSRHSKESRSLVLTELPTADRSGREIDRNRNLRSALAVLLAGAWSSRAVQGKILETQSNREFLRPFGALTIVRAAWFGLASRESVGAAAASYYLSEWTRDAAMATDTERPPRVEARLTWAGRAADVEAFVGSARRAPGAKPPLFDEEVVATSTPAVQIHVDGVPIDVVLPSTPDLSTLARCRTLRSLLAGVSQVIDHARADARGRGERLARRLPRLRQALLSAGGRLFGVGVRASVESMLVGRGPHVRGFRRAHADYHVTARQMLEAEAIDSALGDALKRVERAARVISAFDERVRRTLRALADERLDNGRANLEGIQFRPLQDVYEDFFGAITRGNVSGLREFLPRTATSMDVGALSNLLGTDAAADAIARRFEGVADYEGPFWGGADPPRDPFLRLLVLPPVDAAVLTDLRVAIERLDLPYCVVAADTLAGGASAVTLDLHDVEALRAVFPQAYRSALKEITTTHCDLYPLSRGAHELAQTALVDSPPERPS